MPYISNKYGVMSIEIFGSYVRSEQDVNSDLDVLVSFSKVPSIIKFIELKNYLSDNLQLDVDLVMKDSLKPGISKNILKEAVAI